MKLVLAFALALALHTASAQPLPALATYQGADREQRLLEGARKEGSVAFYATFPSEYAKELIEPFEKRTGIKVNHWRARSEIVLRKALAEGRAGGATADVITIITPQLEALRREGLLQAVQSPNQKDHPAFAIPAHREWAAQVQQYRRLAIPAIIDSFEKVVEEALLQCHTLLEVKPFLVSSRMSF